MPARDGRPKSLEWRKMLNLIPSKMFDPTPPPTEFLKIFWTVPNSLKFLFIKENIQK